MSIRHQNYVDRLHKAAVKQAASGMLYGDFLLNADKWEEQQEQLGAFQRAAVALILFDHEKEGTSLLLSQRAKGLRHHPAQVGFPGGRSEKADKNFLFTAMRETQEEINLKLKKDQLLSPMAAYVSGSGFLVKPFLFYVPDLKPEEQTLDLCEVDRLFSVPLSKLFDPNFCELGSFETEGGARFFARFATKPAVLWGLSAGIVAFLLADCNVNLALKAPKYTMPKSIESLTGLSDLLNDCSALPG